MFFDKKQEMHFHNLVRMKNPFKTENKLERWVKKMKTSMKVLSALGVATIAGIAIKNAVDNQPHRRLKRAVKKVAQKSNRAIDNVQHAFK
jgi:hypothetical protein